ncbi:MAG: 4Fe-4S dicluster domain-containing protein [Bacteroidota bacterium]
MSLALVILSILGVFFIILILPIKGAGSFSYQPPSGRIHEADAVLSRRLLTPGTKSYDSYYAEHPDFREADERSRKAPGLLDEKARYYEPGTFAASKANFQLIDFLGNLTHGSISGSRKEISPQKASNFITHWMKQTGAHSVGITKLRDYHLYSHKGRGPLSGHSIELKHKHAIAITVEMKHRMMQSAPEGTSVMESSEQYLQSGVLALKLASWIRESGYEATAHIDGNYDLICPLVAVDAGLGTLGRMGLLMTPDLGPRVRISVVSTSMPLVNSSPKPESSTLHFCHICKKCADVCPAAAIPDGPRLEMGGIKRWQINSEKCYHFWTTSGTDCGRCISVCPYSHPDNWFHRLVRAAIKNNLVFRYLAIKLDDVLYGRKPSIRPLPEWANLMDKQ